MLAKRIIPFLDIKGGRVVKGVNFVNLRDAGDPIENARLYNDEGADELVFLDISATPEGKATTVDMVRQVAVEVFMPFTVGGGVRSVEDARELLLAVLMLTLSAPAFKRSLMLSRFRTQPPTVRGMNTVSAVRCTTSRMISLLSEEAVISRKVTSSAPCSL